MPKVMVEGHLVEDEEDLSGGFAEVSGIPEKKPVAVQPEPTAEDTAKKAAEDKAALEKKAEEDKKAEADAPVTLTKSQFDMLMAGFSNIDGFKKTIDKLSGTLGVTRQELDTLKKTVPIEITDADFAEMAKEFPEIAAGVKKGLGGVFKRLLGFIPPKGLGDEEIKKAIFTAVNNRETEVLEDEFPDWSDTVGKASDPDNKFRQWLVTQTPQYQKRVNETYSGAVIARAIRKFNSDETTAAAAAKAEADKKARAEADKKAANGRTAALKAAATPRGDGGGIPPKTDKSEDEGLEEGFQNAR